jgi:hypothetical protein
MSQNREKVAWGMQHVGCSLRVVPYGLWHRPAETTLSPVYTGENANHGVKFFAHFCPTNSRVGNAAALIDVDSSPRLFSHAEYFQVTGRCFDGYGL